MKNKQQTYWIAFALLFAVMAMPMLAMAQDGPPSDPDLPIDGGLSLLVAAGVGYGIRKIKGKQKLNTEK